MKNCFDCVAGTLDKTEKISAISKFIEEGHLYKGPYFARKWKCFSEDWLATINIMALLLTKLACKQSALLDYVKLVRLRF